MTAHGSKTEIGNEGSHSADFNIKPQTLATILSTLYVPDGSTGNIFISCCHSGEGYAKALKSAMPAFKGRIFGCVGGIDFPIAPPGDKMWKAA